MARQQWLEMVALACRLPLRGYLLLEVAAVAAQHIKAELLAPVETVVVEMLELPEQIVMEVLVLQILAVAVALARFKPHRVAMVVTAARA